MEVSTQNKGRAAAMEVPHSNFQQKNLLRKITGPHSDTLVYDAFLLSNTSPGCGTAGQNAQLIGEQERLHVRANFYSVTWCEPQTMKEQSGCTQIHPALTVYHTPLYTPWRESCVFFEMLISGKQTHFHSVWSKQFAVQERGNRV